MPVVETETPNPAVPPPNVVPADHVPVPKSHYDELLTIRAERDQIRAEAAAKVREEQDKAAAALLEAGKLKEGMESLQKTHKNELEAHLQKLQETERRTQKYARENALEQALRRYDLVNPTAMKDVVRDVEGMLEVHPDATGKFEVRTGDFKTPAQVLEAYFANPDNAYKLKATTQGGTGPSAGTQQTTPTPAATPAAAPTKDMGTALLDYYGSKPPTAAPFSNSDRPASQDMGKPFGLKRSG
jgi:hypothetical protein